MESTERPPRGSEPYLAHQASMDFSALAPLGKSPPTAPEEVYFPQAANPPWLLLVTRNRWVNATLVEREVREKERQSAL